MVSTTMPESPGTFHLVPNGRLTEHTAHLDVAGAPKVSYSSGGRIVSFAPAKLVIRYQWSWSNGGGWRVLEVKALGVSGTHAVSARFNPEKFPEWIQEAARVSAPPLVLAPAVAEAV